MIRFGAEVIVGYRERCFVQHAVRFSLYLAATIQFSEVSIAHLSVMILGIFTVALNKFTVLNHTKNNAVSNDSNLKL